MNVIVMHVTTELDDAVINAQTARILAVTVVNAAPVCAKDHPRLRQRLLPKNMTETKPEQARNDTENQRRERKRKPRIEKN